MQTKELFLQAVLLSFLLACFTDQKKKEIKLGLHVLRPWLTAVEEQFYFQDPNL